MLLSNKKAFTLVELILTIAVVAILAGALFVATKPQKRIGEANDAKRKNDAQALEQAIKVLASDSGVMPDEFKNLTENQAFAIVKAGGDVGGTYSCTALGTSINKTDISTTLLSVIPQMPIDPDLTSSSNETGYYIIRRGSSYDIEPCNTYRLAATSGTKQMCGDGYCGSSESCSSCAQDCGTCPQPVCGNSIVETGEDCDDGNSSNLDACLNSCLNASCGDSYCGTAESCSTCVSDCGVCQQQSYTAGPSYPVTAVNGGGVDTAWTSPGDVVSDNAVYASVSIPAPEISYYDNSAVLIKSDGSYSSEDKAGGTPWGNNVLSYGNSSALWGETWTPADINDSDFGFAFIAEGIGNGSNYLTQYLKASNFGFNIPLTATITGINVGVERAYSISRGTYIARIDYIRITVYYDN